MARTYAATFSQVAVTAVQDFFEITPATDKPVEIVAVHISQSSDAADAQDEMLSVEIVRGNTTSGSTGSTVTPRPLDQNDTAAGATVEANNTTKASAGTEHRVHSESFNVRAGLVYIPVPEARPRGAGSTGRICVRLVTAPADSLTMDGTVIFREL